MTRPAPPSLETVIGLEVHAQLDTRTKLFCSCPTRFGMPANTQTCPVCLGHPGALPVPNAQAVTLAIRAALALGCSIHRRSVFARKNYFYPDLPKGYQISQYDEPLATGGSVAIDVAGRSRAIALRRVHLEEDAGKSVHDGMPQSDRYSYVDLNRAGVPLIEIVTEPELQSPEEAHQFLQRLRSILRYVGVCDGDMEQGSLRCDANVSLREGGGAAPGPRVELKNLNSFRNVRRALEYEIERQGTCRRSGTTVTRQTALWDVAAGVTRPMRTKEEDRDYRYFPDPDLPPLIVEDATVARIRTTLPELPGARKQRLLARGGLTEYEAQLLTLEPGLADYFEAVVAACGNVEATANFLLNDLQREQNAARRGDTDIPVPAGDLGELIRLVDAGRVSMARARREVFPAMYRSGKPPGAVLKDSGTEEIGDEETLVELIRDVLRRHPAEVAQYRAGKSGLLGHLVARVLRAAPGRVDPRRIHALLSRQLEEEP